MPQRRPNTWSCFAIRASQTVAADHRAQVRCTQKGSRMKEARNGLFVDIQNFFKKTSFFTMHIPAVVPLYGPARTSRAFPHQIARTLVGQEHAPTGTSRPLSPGPDPYGRWQSFGAARPWLRLSWGLGPRCSATHTSRGCSRRAHWHSVCVGLPVFLALGQQIRIVVVMRLTILATIAIAPLFVTIRKIMAINNCTEATSAQASSCHPPPRARTLQVHVYRHTHS